MLAACCIDANWKYYHDHTATVYTMYLHAVAIFNNIQKKLLPTSDVHPGQWSSPMPVEKLACILLA